MNNIRQNRSSPSSTTRLVSRWPPESSIRHFCSCRRSLRRPLWRRPLRAPSETRRGLIDKDVELSGRVTLLGTSEPHATSNQKVETQSPKTQRSRHFDRMEIAMILRRQVYAVLALAVLTSCSARDTKTTHASSPPNCKIADDDHVLEKVGRTIFWLEIKLLEQNRKATTRCDTPRQ